MGCLYYVTFPPKRDGVLCEGCLAREECKTLYTNVDWEAKSLEREALRIIKSEEGGPRRKRRGKKGWRDA